MPSDGSPPGRPPLFGGTIIFAAAAVAALAVGFGAGTALRKHPWLVAMVQVQQLQPRERLDGRPFLHVSVEALAAARGDARVQHRSGIVADSSPLRRPFVLDGGMEGWSSKSVWRQSRWAERLRTMFPEAIAVFYPRNMLDEKGSIEWLMPLHLALDELLATTATPKYLHLTLTSRMWHAFKESGEVLPPRDEPKHERLWLLHDSWVPRCLVDDDDRAVANAAADAAGDANAAAMAAGDGEEEGDGELRREWSVQTGERMLTVGTRGAGMYNHSDTLPTASWHAHVLGNKWWRVCGSVGEGSECYQGTLRPGEILYYPPGWFHETRIVDDLALTLTQAVAFGFNALSLATHVQHACAAGERPDSVSEYDQDGFSARLCDRFDECRKVWSRTPYTDYAGVPANQALEAEASTASPRPASSSWRELAQEARAHRGSRMLYSRAGAGLSTSLVRGPGGLWKAAPCEHEWQIGCVE